MASDPNIKRQRAEAALRESERFLSTLISNLPGWAYRCRNDPHWTMEYVSPGVETLTGYPPAEFLPGGGMSYDRLIHEDDRARVWMEVQNALAKGLPFQVTYRLRTASGEERWMWEQGRAVDGPEGRESLLEGFVTDITDAKRAEDEVRRSGEQQRVLLRELDHRVRNNLVSLIALIDLSARGARSVEELAESMRSRVQAMSITHGLLSQAHHKPIDLQTLIAALVPSELADSVDLEGPAICLSARQSTAMGMVLQELITNSLKHGSLKSPGGRASASWRVLAGLPDDPFASATSLELHWRESNGHAVTNVGKGRVGTALIHGLVQAELRGKVELNYPESGADHRLMLRLDYE